MIFQLCQSQCWCQKWLNVKNLSQMPRSEDQNTWIIKHECLSTFNLGVIFDRTVGKYFIKIIFDIKIKIGLFEISIRQNFNKFGAFLILGPIWA